MSLFSALTTAVGGLAAQSSAIGNISDNLANTSTTGFKGIDTRFEALVTQSNAFTNDPGGVRATPHYQNDVQGNLIQSSSSTSLAITGQGFFPVRPAVVGADGATTFGGTTYYTRAGDFTLNKLGYLVNGGGYYLSGYAVDENGNVDTSSANPIQLAALLDNPVQTSTVSYSANLPASAESTVADPFTSSPSTIQIYDALGATHNLTFTWEKQPSDANLASTIDVQSGALTVTSRYTGTFGNDITITFSAGTNANTTKATVSKPGWADEVFDNIAGTGNTLWQNIATALDAGSNLVTGVAGTSADNPVLSTANALAGGTSSGSTSINFTAEATVQSSIVFDSLSTGTAGNSLAVTIGAGSDGTHKGVAITNGTTTENYDVAVGGTNAAFWSNLATAVNGVSNLVIATPTTTPAAVANGGPYSLSGGLAPLTASNQWFLNVSVPGGGGVSSGTVLDYSATIPFTFNDSTSGAATAGTIQTIGSSTSTGASGSYTPSTLGAATVTLPLDFTGSGATGTQSILVNLGTFGSSSSGVTQFADTNVSVSSFDQNGIPRGSFQSLSIDENGFVTLNYDNGQNRTISQVPVVQFFAQDQLQRVTGGAFAQTLASGNARYSAPGSNGAGTIVGNSLEGSNVDIANEFTKLIQAQRVYSANARTISTADNMLQEVINIIR